MRVCTVDIGTNSIRGLVANVSEPRGVEVLHREGHITRLGEELRHRRVLSASAIERAARAVERIVGEARRIGVDSFKLVATSAARTASNSGELAQRIRQLTSLEMEVISGLEEAEYVCRGAVSGLPLGTKEVLLRCMENAPPDPNVDLLPYVARAFELIGMGKVSTSAKHARSMGFLRPTDRIVVNKDHLVNQAKQTVLAMAQEGYTKPQPRANIRIVGERGYAALKLRLRSMKWAHYISDHDELIGAKLAYVLCGGSLSPRALVDEQYLLDLEREVFVSLCGEEKSQDRMEHMLKVGKPLRN